MMSRRRIQRPSFSKHYSFGYRFDRIRVPQLAKTKFECLVLSIDRVDKVIWLPRRDSSADVSSVSP